MISGLVTFPLIVPHERGRLTCMTYAVTIEYGPDKAKIDEHRPAHREYLRSLIAADVEGNRSRATVQRMREQDV